MSKSARKCKLDEDGLRHPNSAGPGKYEEPELKIENDWENAGFKSKADRMTYLGHAAMLKIAN